jgi:hypothetical protein
LEERAGRDWVEEGDFGSDFVSWWAEDSGYGREF